MKKSKDSPRDQNKNKELEMIKQNTNQERLSKSKKGSEDNENNEEEIIINGNESSHNNNDQDQVALNSLSNNKKPENYIYSDNKKHLSSKVTNNNSNSLLNNANITNNRQNNNQNNDSSSNPNDTSNINTNNTNANQNNQNTKLVIKKHKKKIPSQNAIKKIPTNEILNGPMISIEELEPKYDLLKHNKLIINPGGLVGGRKAKDGFTYFTYNFSPEESNGSDYTDFCLNVSTSIVESINIDDFLFIIYYNQQDRKYFIKFSNNLNVNKEIYIKIKGKEMPIFIRKEEIISIGKVAFKLIPNDVNENIDIVNGDDFKEYKFSSINGKICFGRGDNCDIKVENNNGISKEQCMLVYDGGQRCWVLMDGGDKESMNGTLVMGNGCYPLYNDMEMEVFGNVLKVNYY